MALVAFTAIITPKFKKKKMRQREEEKSKVEPKHIYQKLTRRGGAKMSCTAEQRLLGVPLSSVHH